MRIANIITRLNIGGASPPVISLVTGLAERGLESILVVGTPERAEGTLVPEARARGAEVVELNALGRNPHLVRDASAFAGILSFLRTYKPDVVATHMSKAGALGRVAARIAGVRVIVHTYHGKGFQVFSEGWKIATYLTFERRLATLASGSIVVSEQQRKEFVQWRIGPPEKLEVIRYGLDLEPYVAAADSDETLKAELGLASGVRLVGVVGRLVSIKGQDVFLRAAADIARHRANVQFVLVGDGQERPQYESLVRTLGISNHVHFLGWRRDIPALLSSFAVVVLPTVLDFEGTPLAVIEALAARRPVVATNVGGVAEVVRDGETGLLVAPRRVDQLRTAIELQLDDPTRAARMACAGQRLVVQSYQQERMVQETETYFTRLLNGCESAAAM